MLLGDLELQQGDVPAAIDAWQRIESQNPAFLSLVAERLADAYRRQGASGAGAARPRAPTSGNTRRSICSTRCSR